MAPREVVWGMIHNVARRCEWDPWVIDVTPVTPLPPKRGTRLRLTYQWLLRRAWLDLDYIVWNPPERSAVQSARCSGGSVIRSMSRSWNLHDNGDGTTVWTTVVTLRCGGPLGLPARIFLPGYLMRLIERGHQNMKRLIEAEYEPPPAPVPMAPRERILRALRPQGIDQT
jgi:hypothetical protein